MFQALREELRDFTEQHKLSWEHYCKTLLKHIKSNDGDVIFALTESEFTINRLLDTALQVKFFSCKLNQVQMTEVFFSLDRSLKN